MILQYLDETFPAFGMGDAARFLGAWEPAASDTD
jgi:hypothetical protein